MRWKISILNSVIIGITLIIIVFLILMKDEVSSNITIIKITITALGILIVIILSLISIEGKLRLMLMEEVLRERDTEEKVLYLERSKDTTERKLHKLNSIGKEFLHEKFMTNEDIEYSKLIDKFKKENRKELVQFCEKMLEALYSGEKVTEEKIKEVTHLLKKIVVEEKKKNAPIKKSWLTWVLGEIKTFPSKENAIRKVSTNTQEEISPPIKKERENIAIIAIKREKKEKAKEKEFENVLVKAKAIGAKIYLQRNYTLILLSPTLTKKEENELRAVVIAKEIQRILSAPPNKEHFGIGIEIGDAIVKSKNEIKLEKSEKTIEKAQRSANLARNEILTSTALYEKLKEKINAKDHKGFWNQEQEDN